MYEFARACDSDRFVGKVNGIMAWKSLRRPVHRYCHCRSFHKYWKFKNILTLTALTDEAFRRLRRFTFSVKVAKTPKDIADNKLKSRLEINIDDVRSEIADTNELIVFGRCSCTSL